MDFHGTRAVAPGNLEHSIPVAPTELDFYRSGLPMRTLAAHFTGTIPIFLHSHKNVDAFPEICAMFHAEAQELPGAADKEKT